VTDGFIELGMFEAVSNERGKDTEASNLSGEIAVSTGI
jgi:hypothetical protein